MKIDKRITPPAASKVSAAKGKGAGKSSAPTSGASDSLTLTDSSTRIRSQESDLASVDITNVGKIESVKAALADGSFVVDAEVVADRLIDHTKEALRNRPRKKQIDSQPQHAKAHRWQYCATRQTACMAIFGLAME